MNFAAALSGFLFIVFLSGEQPGQKLVATSFYPSVSSQGGSHQHVLSKIESWQIKPWQIKPWQIESWPNAGSETVLKPVNLLVMELAISISVISLTMLTLRQSRLKRKIQLYQQAVACSKAGERASEERYAALAKAAPVGIFRSDASGKCTYVNQCWCQMTGQTAALALAGGWQIALHPSDRQRIEPDWLQAAREKHSTNFECQIQRPGGTQCWVYAQIVAELTDGRVVGYVGTFIDIDDRKRAEAALRQSEAHQRALVSVLPDLIMRISRGGVFLEFLASPNFRVLGKPKDWIGKHLSTVLPPKLAQQRLTVIKRVLQSQAIEIYEQDFAIEDTIQIEEVRVVPHGADEVLFLVRDVSDRKRAELALQQSEAQSRSILKAIPDFMCRIGIDGIYREFISQPRDFALIPSVGLAGQAMAELLPTEIVNRQQYYLQRAVETGELQRYEQTIRVGDRIQEEEVRVIKSGPDEALLMVRDIGDRKQAERALKQKLRQEQAISQIVQAIRNSLDLATVFATATTEIAQLQPSLDCSVAQYFPEQGFWRIVAKFRQISDSLDSTGVEIADAGNFIAAQLKQLQIVRIEDTRDVKDSINQPLAQVLPGAWLLIPLVIEEKVWGSLTLSTAQYGFSWQDELVNLAQAVAGQLEVAIQQAQLYQQVAAEKQKLLKSQTALAQAQQIARIGNWELEVATQSLSCSDNMFYILGYDRAARAHSLTEIIDEHVHPDDRFLLEQALSRASAKGTAFEIDLRFFKADGSIGYLEVRAEAVRDQHGQITRLFGTSLDISDRVKIEQQLKHDSLHDSLTGLPNRSLLMKRLNQSLKKINCHPNYQFAVLFLDLDNFKVINDSLGHLVGDALLSSIATLLSKTVREIDLAARLGGDEFVVLLDELDHVTEAEQIAERILALLRTPLQIDSHEVFIGTSIGIVLGSAHYKSAEDLLRDADLAMYEAKHSGRDCHALFDRSMHLQALQRLQLENDLRKALKNHEFVLYYQPVVDLETRSIQGFEALIRWQHPERGLLFPVEFVKAAEETGLIEPMGRWVLQTACQQLAQWQTQFFGGITASTEDRTLQINVNLSVRQLQNTLLLELEEVLAAWAISPSSLDLEITESMLVKNVDITVKLLEKIKAKGVRISIDDFGTGYSSLSYLHQLPVDSLKIDRSFVSSIDAGDRHQTIAESITALSKLLKLEVIAEGIETEQQLEWLRSLGCKRGQGYLFSAPVSAERATQMLATKRC